MMPHCQPLLLLLVLMCLTTHSGIVQGSELSLSSKRRRLLEAYVGGPLPSNLHRIQTGLSQQLSGNSGIESIQQQDELPLRGLKLAFYDRLDETRSAEERDYIMNRLMPATSTVLSRSMRVREPSGKLPLAGVLDEEGLTIPGEPDGVDADIVMKVTSLPADSQQCDGLLAGATAWLIEDRTLRPIYGYILLCAVNETEFDNNLSTTVHEVMHALVMDPDMFNNYQGYENGFSDVIQSFDDGRNIVKTPNVVKTVQDFFNCSRMLGAELEDDGGRGSRGSHWEQRVFEGEMMDAVGGSGDSHHYRHVTTDLTLSIAQDSGWYDVIYGSQGFNLFGYQGGCEFSLGTYEQALSSPQSARYLCTEEQALTTRCLHDFSGDGLCFASDLWDGFFRSLPVTSSSVDCMGMDADGVIVPGSRCVMSYLQGSQLLQGNCVETSCSDTGEFLINGAPCDPVTTECPDNDFMCKDPGLLTCLGDLNDCSGKGDCLMGNCYCHTGYGGADCSVPVCLYACEDGSSCPKSGFCGVDPCGTWSRGPLDRGVPCNGATGPVPLPEDATRTVTDDGPAGISDSSLPNNFNPPATDDVPTVAATDAVGSSSSAGSSSVESPSSSQPASVVSSCAAVVAAAAAGAAALW